MNIEDIDFSKLRKDLEDNYGSAMSFFPVAIMDLTRVETASNEELLEIAQKENIDLSKYQKEEYKRY